MTETPDTITPATSACRKCGGTGLVPPFMDACTCGATDTPAFVPAFTADDALASFRPTIPGTTITTPGFPTNPSNGDIVIPSWTTGTYVFNGGVWEVVPAVPTCSEAVEIAVADIEREAEEAIIAALLAAFEERIIAHDDTVTITIPDWSAPAVPTGYSRGGKPASAAQGALLGRLIAERDPLMPLVAAAQTECAAGDMSAKRASSLIDSLLHIAAVKPAHRPNKYDGTCAKCTGNVPAETGRIEKGADGRWKTYHLSSADCLTDAGKAAADADRVCEPGLYYNETLDDIYMVRTGRTSKRLYGAKVIVSTHVHDEVEHHAVDFRYNANAMRFLRKSHKLTWAEAREFGKAYGSCVACGRVLSDPRSLVAMYGSTCAKNYGWPTVTLKQAEAIIAGVVTWEEVTGAVATLR